MVVAPLLSPLGFPVDLAYAVVAPYFGIIIGGRVLGRKRLLTFEQLTKAGIKISGKRKRDKQSDLITLSGRATTFGGIARSSFAALKRFSDGCHWPPRPLAYLLRTEMMTTLVFGFLVSL